MGFVLLFRITEQLERLQLEQQRLVQQLEQQRFRHKQHLFRIRRYHKHRFRSMGRSRSELVGKQLVVRSESS